MIASILIFFFSDKPSSDETIRNVTNIRWSRWFLCLIIAKRRQDRFEEQDKNHVILKAQQTQNFNEQLSRGVVLIADQEKTSIRLAGIRILQKLGETRNKNRKRLVLNILHDHHRKRRIKTF